MLLQIEGKQGIFAIMKTYFLFGLGCFVVGAVTVGVCLTQFNQSAAPEQESQIVCKPSQDAKKKSKNVRKGS